jgi:hypothetical protein
LLVARPVGAQTVDEHLLVIDIVVAVAIPSYLLALGMRRQRAGKMQRIEGGGKWM